MDRNIVIICHNYYPEETSTGLYTTMMSEFLAQNDWNVTMITGFPHYPQWEIDESYKDKATFYKESINGVKVLRYKHFVPSKPTFTNRIVQLIDFSIGSYRNLLSVKEASLIISIIPFTSSAWLGSRFSKRLKARHWIHIQDFEFDAARESGMLAGSGPGSSISRILSRIERSVLNSADLVSTISEGMLKKLSNRTRTERFLFPNWIDPDFINQSTSSKHRFYAQEKFNVLYSGNIGKKQDWDLFIRLANDLQDQKKIRFIVVGDGAERANLEKEVENLENVKIFDPVPAKELNDLLCSADLHVLFQKNNVVDTVMPSKLLGMMASEVPCLVSGNPDSEVAQNFARFKTGYYYDSKDIKEIRLRIEELCANKSKNSAMGKKAREFILETFSTNTVMKKFLSKIESIHAS